MKTKKVITLVFALFLSGWATAQDVKIAAAQEYKVAKSTGRLEIRLGRVTVEGTTGNEIIFSSKNSKQGKDERAAGLRAISGSGLEDNTGLGINVTDKGNVIEVSQLRKMSSPDVKILVPKGIIVSYSYESEHSNKVLFSNMENEIEISANYNSVELVNITGPVTAKSVYGHVEADFSTNVKGPISIVSIYGYADVTLPMATKANLKMSTSYGEIFVAPELKIETDKAGDSEKVSGKINGGGITVDIRSDYGKIYLRKK